MSAEIDKSPLGILAGEGALPVQLTQYCIDNDSCIYNDFPSVPSIVTKMERVGEIFSFFKKHNVQNVVMIGNLQRPSITSMRPDFKGIKTLGRIAGAFMKGDDNLLRSLRVEIENEGFSVKGIDYYLSNLISKRQCLTKRSCDIDVQDAVREALRYGAQDKGQSILLHVDGTYGYETRDGTTSLIQNEGNNGSILVKMVKPNQDLDLDRPTVGLQTLIALKNSGCIGMVIQANGVLMVDRDEMVAYANHNDLFIDVVEAPNA
jgi:DUF1009 family protein